MRAITPSTLANLLKTGEFEGRAEFSGEVYGRYLNGLDTRKFYDGHGKFILWSENDAAGKQKTYRLRSKGEKGAVDFLFTPRASEISYHRSSKQNDIINIPLFLGEGFSLQIQPGEIIY